MLIKNNQNINSLYNLKNNFPPINKNSKSNISLNQPSQSSVGGPQPSPSLPKVKPEDVKAYLAALKKKIKAETPQIKTKESKQPGSIDGSTLPPVGLIAEPPSGDIPFIDPREKDGSLVPVGLIAEPPSGDIPFIDPREKDGSLVPVGLIAIPPSDDFDGSFLKPVGLIARQPEPVGLPPAPKTVNKA